jgi:hypothetical protein
VDGERHPRRVSHAIQDEYRRRQGGADSRDAACRVEPRSYFAWIHTHAKINVNEDGILLVPYIGEEKRPAVVDLPDWNGSQ